MRRILAVAMLSALLAVTPAAVAQHGGSRGQAGGPHGGSAGHANFGGFHGGFSSYGGFHSGYSAPHFGQFVGRAPRIYGGAPHGVSPAPRYGMNAGRLPVFRPAYRPDYHPAYRSEAGRDRRGWRGWRGRDRDHDRFRRHGYSGYGYPYAYATSWEVLPWDLGYSDFSGYDEDAGAAQPASETDTQPEYEPPAETSEENYRPGYQPSSYEAAAAPALAPIAPEPQLTLIFKDGHTQQIRNYAVTQDALLDLDQADSGRVARIPLASLNLPATEKAATQAGLDFTPPTT